MRLTAGGGSVAHLHPHVVLPRMPALQRRARCFAVAPGGLLRTHSDGRHQGEASKTRSQARPTKQGATSPATGAEKPRAGSRRPRARPRTQVSTSRTQAATCSTERVRRWAAIAPTTTRRAPRRRIAADPPPGALAFAERRFGAAAPRIGRDPSHIRGFQKQPAGDRCRERCEAVLIAPPAGAPIVDGQRTHRCAGRRRRSSRAGADG